MPTWYPSALIRQNDADDFERQSGLLVDDIKTQVSEANRQIAARAKSLLPSLESLTPWAQPAAPVPLDAPDLPSDQRAREGPAVGSPSPWAQNGGAVAPSSPPVRDAYARPSSALPSLESLSPWQPQVQVGPILQNQQQNMPGIIPRPDEYNTTSAETVQRGGDLHAYARPSSALPSLESLTPWARDAVPDQPSGLTSIPQASATPTFPQSDLSGGGAVYDEGTPQDLTDPHAIQTLAQPAIDVRQGRDAVLQAWAPALRTVEQGGGPSARNLAAIILAENGAGQAGSLAPNDNNWFSISHVPGREFQAGPGTGGRFAHYDSPLSSVADFVDLIKNSPRYADAWALRNAPTEQFIGALAKAGYIVPEPGFPVETWLQNTSAGANVFDKVAGAIQAGGRAVGGMLQGAKEAVGRVVEGGLDPDRIISAYQGVPYTFGGAGGRGQGIGAPTDCSGFVSAWAQSQGVDLPAHTDAAYNEILNQTGHQVTSAEAQPGDIVFYMGAGTGGAITHHMGIYAGPGKVLDMSVANGGGVQERDIGHGGQYVILRDDRLSGAAGAQAPGELAEAPPIVPSSDSGGDPSQVKPLDDPQANFRAAVGGGKRDGLFGFGQAFNATDQSSGDSTYGPFDPQGYGQPSVPSNADPSDFPATPPTNPLGYGWPDNPDQPSGLSRTPAPSATPTFPAQPQGGIGGSILGGIQRVGQGLGDFSNGLAGGLNSASETLTGGLNIAGAPETLPTPDQTSADGGIGGAALAGAGAWLGEVSPRLQQASDQSGATAYYQAAKAAEARGDTPAMVGNSVHAAASIALAAPSYLAEALDVAGRAFGLNREQRSVPNPLANTTVGGWLGIDPDARIGLADAITNLAPQLTRVQLVGLVGAAVEHPLETAAQLGLTHLGGVAVGAAGRAIGRGAGALANQDPRVVHAAYDPANRTEPGPSGPEPAGAGPPRLIVPGDETRPASERTIYGPSGEAISTPRDAMPLAERSAVDPGQVQGFGYSEGHAPESLTTLAAASTNEKQFTRVSHEETDAAARALMLNPSARAALNEESLSPGFTRQGATKIKAASLQAHGALENVRQLQAQAERLRNGDLPAEQHSEVAARAAQAAKDSADLNLQAAIDAGVQDVRALRRQAESAGRTLNALKITTQVQNAQVLRQKAEKLSDAAKQAAYVIRKGRHTLGPGDLDRLETAAGHLEENGHLAGSGSPAVDAVRERLEPLAVKTQASEPTLAELLGALEREHAGAHGDPARQAEIGTRREVLLERIRTEAEARAREIADAQGKDPKNLSPEEVERSINQAVGGPTVTTLNNEALAAERKARGPDAVQDPVRAAVDQFRTGERTALKDDRAIAKYWLDQVVQFPDDQGIRQAAHDAIETIATHGVQGQKQAEVVKKALETRLGASYDALMAGVQRRNAQAVLSQIKAEDNANVRLMLGVRGRNAEATLREANAAEAKRTSDLAQQLRDFVKAARSNPEMLTTGTSAWGDSRLSKLHEDLMLAGKNGAQRASELRHSLYKAGVTKLLGKVDDERLAAVVAAVGKAQTPEEMGVIIRALRTPGRLDYLTEWQYAMMLSSPVTHLNNLAQNTLQVAGRLAFEPLAIAGDVLTNPGNRQRSASEIPAAFRGAAGGVREGLAGAAAVMRTGERPGAGQQALELGKFASINREYLTEKFGRLGGVLHSVSSRPLEAMDVLIGHIAYASALEQNVAREAAMLQRTGDQRVAGMSGAKAQSFVREHIWDFPRAVEDAGKVKDYTLLRGLGKNEVEQTLGRIAGWRNAPPGSSFERQALAFLGNQALPFFGVPLNYAKQGLDRAVGAPYNTVKALTAPVAERGDYFKRATVGYAVMGTAMALAAGDNLTGDGPSDPAKRDEWLIEHQPNSVRVPGTKDWHSYQGTPWGIPFAVVANTRENMDEATTAAGKKDLPAFETGSAIVHGAIRGTASGIANQTFLQNLGQMYGQITGTQDAFPALATGTAARFIQPALVRFLARVTDDMERDATHGQTSQEQIGQRLASGYPGARQTLPVRQDVLGKAEPNQSFGLRGIAPPFLQTRQGFEPGNATIKAFTDAGVSIPRPADHLTLDVKGGGPGESLKVPLSAGERQQWNASRGQALEQAWRTFQQGPNWAKYQQGDPAFQKAVVESILQAASDTARDQIVKQIGTPEIRRRVTPAA